MPKYDSDARGEIPPGLVTVVSAGVAQTLLLLGWSGYHGLDRS